MSVVLDKAGIEALIPHRDPSLNPDPFAAFGCSGLGGPAARSGKALTRL